MINRVQANTNQPSFRAWLELSGNKKLLSKECIKKIRSSVEEIGDPNDMVKIHISNTYTRDNSWSEMRNRFTVPETVRTTYMNAIVNGEHFNNGVETKEDILNGVEIGTHILSWLEKLPRYKD